MTIVVSQFGNIISKIMENHVLLMYVNFSFLFSLQTLDKRQCKYGKLSNFYHEFVFNMAYLEQFRLYRRNKYNKILLYSKTSIVYIKGMMINIALKAFKIFKKVPALVIMSINKEKCCWCLHMLNCACKDFDE